MKQEHTTFALVLLVVAAVALGTVGLVIWRLDLDRLFTLVLILVVAVAIAIVSVGVAFIVRANRSGGPRTREVVRERERHTHTIDGRQPPSPPVVVTGGQPQLPSFFPHLLRAAYQTGQGDRRQYSVSVVDDQPGSEDPDGWSGDEWTGDVIDVDATKN
jgi:hypothetical protein